MDFENPNGPYILLWNKQYVANPNKLLVFSELVRVWLASRHINPGMELANLQALDALRPFGQADLPNIEILKKSAFEWSEAEAVAAFKGPLATKVGEPLAEPISMKEAAQLLGISSKTLGRWIDNGQIRGEKINRKMVRLHPEDDPRAKDNGH